MTCSCVLQAKQPVHVQVMPTTVKEPVIDKPIPVPMQHPQTPLTLPLMSRRLKTDYRDVKSTQEVSLSTLLTNITRMCWTHTKGSI